MPTTTHDLASRSSWEMEALSLHEAVPGHHLQIASAQELEETHDLLKHRFYPAFAEGWGLYAESLGDEVLVRGAMPLGVLERRIHAWVEQVEKSTE